MMMLVRNKTVSTCALYLPFLETWGLWDVQMRLELKKKNRTQDLYCILTHNLFQKASIDDGCVMGKWLLKLLLDAKQKSKLHLPGDPPSIKKQTPGII